MNEEFIYCNNLKLRLLPKPKAIGLDRNGTPIAYTDNLLTYRNISQHRVVAESLPSKRSSELVVAALCLAPQALGSCACCDRDGATYTERKVRSERSLPYLKFAPM